MAFNRRAEHLTAIRADQVAGLSDRVAEVNKLAGQVAELNKEISHVLSVGEQPNDLLDSRDMALDRLAELTGAVSHLQSNGEVLVSIGGHVLVTGHEAVALAAGPVNPGGPFTIRWADGGSYQPPAGEIKGLWEAYNTIVPAQLDQLDRLAQALRDQVNARHVTGFGLAGETGQAFFGGSGARDLVIDANLTASAVAAAKQAGKPGDGSLAADLFALKSDTTTMAGTSFHGAYNAQITDFGLKVQAARQNAFHHDLIRKALGEQRESVAGVSLDEEAANLAKAQRAYQAAARVMTVYDEMLDRIINGLGLVGR
jgi:flagellar hook-associated protein 1 FlgK